jgi:pimeloyl-ACP methyl ester carboxylesterase
MSLGSLGNKLGLPGFNIPLHEALVEIEADRFERTHGTSFFAWPVRVYSRVADFFHTSSWSLLSTIALGILLAMYLIDAIPSLFSLRLTQKPEAKMSDLPKGLKRIMIRGSEGKLELLISESPAVSRGSKPAVLFIHGGFGSAGVWIPWMRILHDETRKYAGNLYALSLRGHGGSFSPGYLEMAYLTSMTTLSMDVAAAMKEIVMLEEAAGNKSGLVIAAHSSGGGLVQHAIASGKLPIKMLSKIGGLVGVGLIAATPPFGSLGIYWNWFMTDPFFLIRMNIHAGHPRSPLSSTKLVRGAFFSGDMPELEIKEFEKSMANYESFIWPSQMMFGRYVDADEVFARMTRKNVFVMAADGDNLMGVQGQRKMAREYANVLRAEDMEEKFVNVHDVRIEAEGTIDGAVKKGGNHGSLQLNLVRGSGHHVMNDVKKDAAVEVFRKWVDGV